MVAENRWLIMPDVKFGTSELSVKSVLVTDIYAKHVEPIAKVYVDKSLGTVFMPLSMVHKTKHDALIALRDMCYRIAKETEKELEKDGDLC